MRILGGSNFVCANSRVTRVPINVPLRSYTKDLMELVGRQIGQAVIAVLELGMYRELVE